jgi:hypothetical protein
MSANLETIWAGRRRVWRQIGTCWTKCAATAAWNLRKTLKSIYAGDERLGELDDEGLLEPAGNLRAVARGDAGVRRRQGKDIVDVPRPDPMRPDR